MRVLAFTHFQNIRPKRMVFLATRLALHIIVYFHFMSCHLLLYCCSLLSFYFGLACGVSILIYEGNFDYVTDCPISFLFTLTSTFGLTFSRLLHMASTGYISISAIFYLLLSRSIAFRFLLLHSDILTRTSLNIPVVSDSFVYIRL